jgi:hypothetical protein
MPTVVQLNNMREMRFLTDIPFRLLTGMVVCLVQGISYLPGLMQPMPRWVRWDGVSPTVMSQEILPIQRATFL